jgi:hypothetical protein
MCLRLSYKLKRRKKIIFFCILKVNEEWSMIQSWIWIRIHKSEVRIPGSGSAPKCHGSPTLPPPPPTSYCIEAELIYSRQRAAAGAGCG